LAGSGSLIYLVYCQEQAVQPSTVLKLSLLVLLVARWLNGLLADQF
jgi:hypothetical protein